MWAHIEGGEEQVSLKNIIERNNYVAFHFNGYSLPLFWVDIIWVPECAVVATVIQ